MRVLSPALRLSLGMVFYALLVLACTIGVSGGNEGTISAEVFVDKIIASEKEIHDVRAEYVFFEPETNMPLLYAGWGYEGGRESIAGIWFVRAEDNQGYKSSCRQKHSLDGKGTYYFFSEEVESRRTGGSVKCLSIGISDTFRANMTPNSLLGFDVTCGIRQTFGQALKGDEEKVRFNWGVKSLPWLILADEKHVVRSEGFGIEELDEKVGGLSNAKP